MEVTTPATRDRIDTYREDAAEDVEAALTDADDVSEGWRDRSIRERERLLASVADVLRENSRRYAETTTREMGKPIDQAVDVVDSETEAVEKANDTDFGLGASVWTDRERGERIAHQIEAGCVSVDQPVRSDPRVPFGGVGESGYGRELSEPGITVFLDRKTVWVE